MLVCEWQASVRYVLRVKLDSTNASLRQMCRDCGFVVSRPLDLNQISPLYSGTPRHWTSATAAFVDDQLPPVDVSHQRTSYLSAFGPVKMMQLHRDPIVTRPR